MTHICPTKSKTLKYVCPTSCKTMKYSFHTSSSTKLSRPIPLNIETEDARVGQAFMTHACPTKSKTLKYVCPTSCKTMKYSFHTSRSINLSCPSPLLGKGAGSRERGGGRRTILYYTVQFYKKRLIQVYNQGIQLAISERSAQRCEKLNW